MIKQIQIQDLNAIDSAAKELVSAFKDKRIFCLNGVMGAGKTTFIKAISKFLGSKDIVVSPTFAICNCYSLTENQFIYHFDFYRLTNSIQALDIGIEEYFYSGNYCFIEWGEKIEEYLPKDRVEVNINILDNNSRLIIAKDYNE